MKNAIKTAWSLYSTAIVMLLLLLFIIPGEMILNKTPLCESVSSLNIECFACGLTRGFIHISQFEFYEASESNRGSVYVFFVFILNTLFFIKYVINLKSSVKITFLRRKQKWAKAV